MWDVSNNSNSLVRKYLSSLCGIFVATIMFCTPALSRGIEMDSIQFRDMVIIPALQEMDTHLPGANSEAAVMLLLGTALVESDLKWIKQHKGPALGVFQIEPATADDIMKRYIAGKPRFVNMFDEMFGGKWRSKYKELIVTDLRFAVVVCRLRYWMETTTLPQDLEGLAQYWDHNYNANKRKGTTAQFIAKYKANVA